MKKVITFMMAFAIAMPTFAQFEGSRQTKNRFNHSNVEQYYGLRLGYNIACINSSDALIDTESYGGLALGGIQRTVHILDGTVRLTGDDFFR